MKFIEVEKIQLDKLLYEGVNSKIYLFKQDAQSAVIKFYKIPEGFQLKRKDFCKSLCNIESPYVLPYWQVASLESVLQVAPQGHTAYSIHPYVEMQDARVILPTMNAEAILIWFIRLLKGWQAIHRAGILHGDINLENIRCQKVRGQFLPLWTDINTLEPEKGEISLFISPEFMAPHVHEYKDYDLKAEIWALGVYLYTMCIGKFPFGSRQQGSSEELELIAERIRAKNIDWEVLSILHDSLRGMIKCIFKEESTPSDIAQAIKTLKKPLGLKKYFIV